MIRRWIHIALACAALLLSCAVGARAAAPAAAPADAAEWFGAVWRRLPRAWWASFNDEVLNRLVDAAHLNATAARSEEALNASASEVGVAAAYVSVRVHSLALIYLDNERAAIGRQQQLMVESRPEHDGFIRELQMRRREVDAHIQEVRAQRDRSAAYLAQHCGIQRTALIDAIGEMPPDQLRALPQFSRPVPRALSTALLAHRDDIHLAAALYGVDPDASLAGLIEAPEAGDPDRAEDAGSLAAGYPLYLAVVSQARTVVAEALRRLQARSDSASAAYRRAVDAQLRYQASTLRRDRGEVSEVILMEDFQILMQGLHALAIANGNLAIAWITLIARLDSGSSVEGNPLTTAHVIR